VFHLTFSTLTSPHCPLNSTSCAALLTEVSTRSVSASMLTFAPCATTALDGVLPMRRATPTPAGAVGSTTTAAASDAVLELQRHLTHALCPRTMALVSAMHGLTSTAARGTAARLLTILAHHMLSSPEGVFGHEATVGVRAWCLTCCWVHHTVAVAVVAVVVVVVVVVAVCVCVCVCVCVNQAEHAEAMITFEKGIGELLKNAWMHAEALQVGGRLRGVGWWMAARRALIFGCVHRTDNRPALDDQPHW